ncbi:protein EPIDERMAL PATTERNING FACTOR 2-like [Prosopis cineraria]|uniref:protein EPIDERMAL PATTERNING FACTOR 2-like n=1 Tax=Prosopis cineraria TaxID=364024 RepID=UPI002410B506|nr:protein EPIDERMAL PATTERNING FACTOR 2-like [Prosopis cineraria]
MNTCSLPIHRSFLLIMVFLMLLSIARSLRMIPSQNELVSLQEQKPANADKKEELGMELYPTGSTLPDCSHACGPCFPCKRVMVSFKCSSAESCPIVYRCVCRGKYYHVPSN